MTSVRLIGKLDVSRLKDWVEEQNLMMFPVLVYLLSRQFSQNNREFCLPCYSVVSDDGIRGLVCSCIADGFASFYKDYVNNWLAFCSGACIDKALPNRKKIYISFFEDFFDEVKNISDGEPCFVFSKQEEGDTCCLALYGTLSQNTETDLLFSLLQKSCDDCCNLSALF